MANNTIGNISTGIGKTPVVRLTKIAPNQDVAVYAKLEGANPGGSVKDRIALAMIEAAENQVSSSKV